MPNENKDEAEQKLLHNTKMHVRNNIDVTD